MANRLLTTAVVIGGLAGIGYILIKKSPLAQNEVGARLAAGAEDVAEHAKATASEFRGVAMDATAKKVEDVAGRTADRLQGTADRIANTIEGAGDQVAGNMRTDE